MDVLEQAGIDEAFFDVTKKTGGDYGAATALALELKDKIFREEKLTCSIGIGPNKVVAKIASDFKKPNGLTVVRTDEAPGLPLPPANRQDLRRRTKDREAPRGERHHDHP